jgi:lysylphosphatidylglycerol synthetase-like protein (DUF2156 family)
MEATIHTMNDLFSQLGLPSGDADVERFIASHAPLADAVTLPEAPFWNSAQATFLREEWIEDGDWVEVIDELDVFLRAPRH